MRADLPDGYGGKTMRKIALLLVCIMLFAVVAGCKPAGGDVSDTSGEVSATQPEASKDTSDEVSKEEVNKIPVENPGFATVISTGASYKNESAAADSYADSYGTELTDGQVAPDESDDYKDTKYSGYTDATVYVTIDLGKVYENIYEFRCGFYAISTDGIMPPRSVGVLVSEDGEKFTNVGFCTIPKIESENRGVAVLTSEYYLTARYVRFAVAKNSAWVFMDELMVVANEESDIALDEAFLEQIKNAYAALGTVKFDGGKAADKSLALELISKNAKYSASKKAVSDFPDDGKRLTDGTATGYYESGIWVGYEGGESVSITIDLGKKRDDISRFRAQCYSNMNIGSYMPSAVTYAVSDDNKTFNDVGRVYGIATGQSVYDFPLILDKCASGRYVRVTLEATETRMYLLEEIFVYANTGVVQYNGLYPELVFDATEKTWPNPSTDTKNLILGLTQQINCPSDISEEAKANNTPITSTIMTNGKKATSNSIHNGQFFKFNQGASREIFYDLGATSAVQKFTAQFTHLTDWAVLAPATVTVLLSMDGNRWYTAGVMPVNTTSDNCLADAEFSLSSPVRARYVCFSMDISTWCGIGELEVFGTTSVSGVTALASSGLKERNMFSKGNQAPREDVLNGVQDLVLLYHSPKFDGYTVDTLIPYLAYVDENGNIKDTMFDSFLFLLSGGFPSGLSGWSDSKGSDWLWTITDLFTQNENILALEEAAGIVKDALELDDDYKYGFTVTLYYPNSERTDFGDIDGDGKVDGLTTDENRLRALEWYMEEFEKKLAQYDFENIEFVGYYWYDESVYPTDNAPYIVAETSKIVHERGYDFFWIPYYTASGFSAWEDFGFDVACMQPNYVFDEEVPYSRIEQAAYLTQLYGMGVEIEISGKSLTNDLFYRKYMEYLSGGYMYGYMKDCVHMYYQDVAVYYDAATSKDSGVRKVYDYTYQFIKGTLQPYPETLNPLYVSGAKDNPVSATLMEDAPGYYLFELASSPAVGTVSIAADGSFTYYPEAGFTGTVTFEYSYTEGLCDSEPCMVTITIE